MFTIEPFAESDWPELWRIMEPVFRAGETYPYPREISEQEAHRAWIETPTATYVAKNGAGGLLGTYYVRSNQPGLGAHVCNCGYLVAEHARGQGVATALCGHSLAEGRRLGFRAMQYNLVVSTNEVAMHLWQKCGFHIVGKLPAAFQHARLGYVDAFVMYQEL